MHTPTDGLGGRVIDPSALFPYLRRLARVQFDSLTCYVRSNIFKRKLKRIAMYVLSIFLFIAALLIGQLVSDGRAVLLLLLSNILSADTRILCTVCIHVVAVFRAATSLAGVYTVLFYPWIVAFVSVATLAVCVTFAGKRLQRHTAVSDQIELSIYRLTYDQFAHCDHCAHKNLCPMHSLEKMEELRKLCLEQGIDLIHWQHQAHTYFHKYPNRLAPLTVAKPSKQAPVKEQAVA